MRPSRAVIVGFGMAMAGISGCGLGPDLNKNRCMRDANCLSQYRCVAGYCVDATRLGFGSQPSGAGHTCIVLSDDSLWCWGDNRRGQLGLGGTAAEELPRLVGSSVDPNRARWRVVAAGGEHTCAVREDMSLWCWGRGDHGALRGEPSEDIDAPLEALRGRKWRTIAAGAEHSCGLEHSGSLWCWGDNSSGQLGAGPADATGSPVEVTGGPWQEIAAKARQACGITEKGTLWCWGTRAYSPETNNTTRLEPTRVDNANDWALVAVGAAHACGIKEDHSLWCWGDNDHGMLGAGDRLARESPLLLHGDWLQVACGKHHTCALARDHSLWCWGRAHLGQLGSDTRDEQQEPRRVDNDRDWVAVAAGENHSCGWRRDGTFWCWGDNRQGQVGKGFGLGRSLPARVTRGPSQWLSVATGGMQSCAIGLDSTLWCWGQSAAGEEGWFEAASRPRQIGESNDWTAVGVGSATASSEGHLCAIKKDEHIWCWGDNTFGQLGLGYSAGPVVMEPERVDGSRAVNVAKLSLGLAHTCIVADRDVLTCCGLNDFGQLGREVLTTEDPPFEPTFVYGLTWADCSDSLEYHRWREVTSGRAHSCGIADDRTLWCWGDNEFRQTTHDPTGDCWVGQVGTATWSSVSAGDRHTCAIDGPIGGLWCWGGGASGQLGRGTLPSYAPPVLLTSANGWKEVSSGSRHTCGVDAMGALWCWGANDHGQLGLGAAAGLPVPSAALVDDGAKWRSVAAAEDHTCAVRIDDDSLWCWGSNYQGQLGIGGAWYDTPEKVYPY